MTKNGRICDTDLLSRYYDNELGPGVRSELERHIRSCASCRKRLEEYRLLSKGLRSGITLSENQERVLQDNVLESINRKKPTFLTRFKEMNVFKRSFIPVGVMACLLIALVTFYYTPESSGPTAIITSLSGSGSNVTILETPENRQTILWFDENV